MEDTNKTFKPNMLTTYTQKHANDGKWFENTADYYLGLSKFKSGSYDSKNLDMLYDVYNSKFPLSWFSHHLDPLSAKDSKYKNFPAKIRPTNILRTNLDLMIGEYPNRPFIFQVDNLSSRGYSRYIEQLEKAIRGNIEEQFRLLVMQGMMESGMIDESGQPTSEEAKQQIEEQLQNLPIPEDVKAKFTQKYKDSVASEGHVWLKRMIKEHRLRAKFTDLLFKDWVIAGEAYSYKSVANGTLEYRRVSPKHIDYGKSDNSEFVMDSEWVVEQRYLTLSDIVDEYYKDLTKEQLNTIAQGGAHSSEAFFSYLSSRSNNKAGLTVVYKVMWKGRKRLKIVSGVDENGQPYSLEMDEDYIVDKENESVEVLWINELYETTIIDADIYVQKREVPFQSNVMNNSSKCKMPYNGRKYSDLHSENVSLTELGLPYLIMYIITGRTLELTIAKSKGKILLIDQNAIPKDSANSEEKFFYYAEALGYGLLKRNQIGVDKSWNQYQVLDMSLFDSISQLIELQAHYKQEWDDVIGITRQRKGQMMASDLVGVTERSNFQSTVITEPIFRLFEGFIETELNAILNLSKFTEREGERRLWNSSEYGNEIFAVNPDEYCNEDLGVFVDSSSDATLMKNKIEASVTAMLQNGTKVSTIIDILYANNVAEIRNKVAEVEALQAQSEQSIAQQEEANAKAADDRKKEFAEFENMLDLRLLGEEYDRKEDIEMIKGAFNTYTFQDGDSNDNGVPDAMEVAKMDLANRKLTTDVEQKSEDRKLKREEMRSKEKMSRNKNIKTK